MSKTRVVELKVALNGRGSRAGRTSVLDRNSNLHDAAYEQIRQALMDGRFLLGQTFTIRTLAEVFGTSPMPVRDALKRLVAERALELRPNRSVVLPFMSRARFQEILQVRLVLEPMLATRAASRIGPAQIKVMAREHESMCAAVAAREATAFLVANRRFHFCLYEAAESIVTLPLVESLWMQIGPYLHQIFASQKTAKAPAAHYHMDVLHALRRQDAAATAKAIWSDLADAGDEILTSNLFAEARP